MNQARLQEPMNNTPSITRCISTEDSLPHTKYDKTNVRSGDENQKKIMHDRISTSATTCPPPSIRILDPVEFLENGGTEYSGPPSLVKCADTSSSGTKPIAIAIPLGVDSSHFAMDNTATLAEKTLPPDPFPQTMVALLCSGTVLLGLAVVGTLVGKILNSYNNVYTTEELWG